MNVIWKFGFCREAESQENWSAWVMLFCRPIVAEAPLSKSVP